MLYYFPVFLCAGAFSVALVFLKRPFIKFARATAGLLDIMLDGTLDEDAKQKAMIRKLAGLLIEFGLFLLFLASSCSAAILPLLIYLSAGKSHFRDLDAHSFYFYLAMVLGSGALFVFPNKDKGKDYNDWTRLLHRMILDNYNISRGLFGFEKKTYKKKIGENADNNFVIVTGLARGGTTAFTNLLYGTGKFCSLSYENMPFLLSVNLWGKIYSPKKNNLRERAHGDNIKFGHKTIEALEEFFYKTQLNDSFIKENALAKHEITEEIYHNYISYRQLIGLKTMDKIYLAKNNNLILRYKSLRKFNKDFCVMMMLREPLEHAESLMGQHEKFLKIHEEDPFALEYMNWLGHHEFGLNHKPFQLDSPNKKSKYPLGSLDYWVNSWIEYYSYVLENINDDKKLFLIDYNDLCSSPGSIIYFVSGLLNVKIDALDLKPYNRVAKKGDRPKIDSFLLMESTRVYNELLTRKTLFQDINHGQQAV